MLQVSVWFRVEAWFEQNSVLGWEWKWIHNKKSGIILVVDPPAILQAQEIHIICPASTFLRRLSWICTAFTSKGIFKIKIISITSSSKKEISPKPYSKFSLKLSANPKRRKRIKAKVNSKYPKILKILKLKSKKSIIRMMKKLVSKLKRIKKTNKLKSSTSKLRVQLQWWIKMKTCNLRISNSEMHS